MNNYGDCHICFGFYSRLQLLTTLYNSLNEVGIMNVFVVVLLDVQIISLYVLVAMNVDQAISVLLVMISVDSFLAVFIVFGKASRVCPMSAKVKQVCFKAVASAKTGNPRNFYRKVVRSWSSIKIGFFSNNFFDQLTPLKFEQFCFDSTITLLLLHNRKLVKNGT